MKRLFTRLLVLVLALALTACGGQASNDVPPASTAWRSCSPPPGPRVN